MFLIWMLSSQWPITVNSIVSIAISSSSNNVVESASQYLTLRLPNLFLNFSTFYM
jgi:hypothetical protein